MSQRNLEKNMYHFFLDIYYIIALIIQSLSLSNLLTVVLLTKYKHGEITEDARVTNAIFYKNTAIIKTATPNMNFDLSSTHVV